MKKIFVVLVSVIMLMSVFSITACSDENPTYDAGEYGEVVNSSFGTPDVKCKEGYRFLGWSEPVKEGRKTICKAQYEHIEFYLSEVKDVYIFEQGIQKGPSIISRITNLQTNEKTETPVNLHTNAEIKFYGNDSIEYEYNPIKTGMDLDKFCANIKPYEFDVIEEVTINYPEYNIVANFELRFVRNRIIAENIEISIVGGNVIGVNAKTPFRSTTLPEETSFTECGYTILGVIRNGQALAQDQIKNIAYFNEYQYLCTTEQAQVDDIIRVQAFNVRDPEVKSNILEIIVY